MPNRRGFTLLAAFAVGITTIMILVFCAIRWARNANIDRLANCRTANYVCKIGSEKMYENVVKKHIKKHDDDGDWKWYDHWYDGQYM